MGLLRSTARGRPRPGGRPSGRLGALLAPCPNSALERWAAGTGPEWPAGAGPGRGEAEPGLEGGPGAGEGARGAGRGPATSLPPSLSFFLSFSLPGLFFASAAGRGGGLCSLCCQRTERSRPPGRSPGPGRRELHAGRACPEPDPGPGSERTRRECARGIARRPPGTGHARRPESPQPRAAAAPTPPVPLRSGAQRPRICTRWVATPAGRPCHPSPLPQPRFSPFSPLQDPVPSRLCLELSRPLVLGTGVGLGPRNRASREPSLAPDSATHPACSRKEPLRRSSGSSFPTSGTAERVCLSRGSLVGGTGRSVAYTRWIQFLALLSAPRLESRLARALRTRARGRRSTRSPAALPPRPLPTASRCLPALGGSPGRVSRGPCASCLPLPQV